MMALENNVNLFPGKQVATTMREIVKDKISSFSVSCRLSQECGCHFSLLHHQLLATAAFPSAPGTKAADAPTSQTELGGLARKPVIISGRQRSALEPTPQRPPGEISEPPPP